MNCSPLVARRWGEANSCGKKSVGESLRERRGCMEGRGLGATLSTAFHCYKRKKTKDQSSKDPQIFLRFLFLSFHSKMLPKASRFCGYQAGQYLMTPPK